MAISDVIGVLLIVALLGVVLWRIFEVRLDHKIRKRWIKQFGITNAIKWTMKSDCTIELSYIGYQIKGGPLALASLSTAR